MGVSQVPALLGCVLRRGIPLLSVSQAIQVHFCKCKTQCFQIRWCFRFLPSGSRHAQEETELLKRVQHSVSGARLGDLPGRKLKTQAVSKEVATRWEPQHAEAPGCGEVCVNSVESRRGRI